MDDAVKQAVLERLGELEDEVSWMKFNALPPLEKVAVLGAMALDDAVTGGLPDLSEKIERLIEKFATSGDREGYLASERLIMIRDRMAEGTPPLQAMREAFAMFENDTPWTEDQIKLAEAAWNTVMAIYEEKQ